VSSRSGFCCPLALSGASFVTDIHVRDFGANSAGILIAGQSLIDGCTVTDTIPGTSGIGIEVTGTSVVRNCVVTDLNGQGVDLEGSGSTLESSQIVGNGRAASAYGVKISALNSTVRNSTLENGSRDIGVFANAATIIDNAIHCAASIVNTNGSSYYAPTGTEAHANVPRYGVGFC
jgi:hypothetical protein